MKLLKTQLRIYKKNTVKKYYLNLPKTESGLKRKIFVVLTKKEKEHTITPVKMEPCLKRKKNPISRS